MPTTATVICAADDSARVEDINNEQWIIKYVNCGLVIFTREIYYSIVPLELVGLHSVIIDAVQ